MFNNIRYVDPKLFYEYGIPDISENIGLSNLVDVFSFNDQYADYQEDTIILDSQGGFMVFDFYSSEIEYNNPDYIRNCNFSKNYVISTNVNVNGYNSLVNGYGDYFVQKFIGYLDISQEEVGTYCFRAYGDDRGLLYIDDTMVTFNGSGNDASYVLTQGFHFIEFYTVEISGGQSWYLKWKKPSSSSFEDFPASRIYYPLYKMVDKIKPSGNEAVRFPNIKFSTGGMLNRNFVENGKIEYETAKGAKFDNELMASNDGYTLETARYFSLESSNGTTVSDTISSSHKNLYYRVKLLANVSYTFVYTQRDFDAKNALYKEDGTVVIADFDNNSTNERMDYTPTEDGNYIFWVHPYSSGTGNFTYSVTPAPETYLPSVEADSGLLYKDFTSEDLTAFLGDSDGKFTVSLWYKPENEMQGTLISLNNASTCKASIYILNSKLYLYDGASTTELHSLTDNDFTLKGSKYYCNIVLRRKGTYGIDIFLNNSVIYTTVSPLNITGNRFMVGDSLESPANAGVLKGRIKALRIYNRELTNLDIGKIYNELANIPGDGTSIDNAYGQIPSFIENDTLYILRRYNDGTATRIDFDSTQTASKVGIYGCPDVSDQASDSNSDYENEFWENLPDEVKTCPWIYDDGVANFYQPTPTACLKASSIKHFECRNLNILTNEKSERYLFELDSDNRNFTIFDRCRFSSRGSNIDDPLGDKYSSYDRWYYRHNSGTLQNLIITNCVILFCNHYYDAFRCNYCTNATIKNNIVYSGKTHISDEPYNGFCFTFIRNCEQTYNDEPYNGRERYRALTRRYDDSQEEYYSGNTYLHNLLFENNTQIFRYNSLDTTYYRIQGLLCATNVRSARVNNVNIYNENDFGVPKACPCNYNGLIYLRGMVHYNIKNITILLPYSGFVGWLPIVNIISWFPQNSMVYDNNASTYPNYAANYDRLVENVEIYMGDQNAIGENSKEQVVYTTSESHVFNNELFNYCAFAFTSLNDSSYFIDLAKNINVIAPYSGGLFLKRTVLNGAYIDGPLRTVGSKSNIQTIRLRRDLPAMILFFDNHVKVEDVTYDLSSATSDVVVCGRYGSSASTRDSSRFIYIKNCSKRIIENKFFYEQTDSTYMNDSIIYCPNTIGVGGLTYQSYLHGLFATEYRREGGNSVSLAFRVEANKNLPFALPVFPNNGIKKECLAGRNKLILHFAMVGFTLEDITKQTSDYQFYIEFEVDNRKYDSRLNGAFSLSDDIWNSNILIPFKFELDFYSRLTTNTYMRIYFNIPSDKNNLLLFDPLFEITPRSLI